MVNPELFRTKLPKLFPKTIEYDSFWKREIQRCIEGYWVSGQWMPGKLYFYINYATIKLNKPGSKVKTYGLPWLRDIEWMVFYNWEEARGFSGFEDDTSFTCNRLVLDTETTDEELVQMYCLDEHGDVDPVPYNNLFTSTGKRKEYIPAREYMRMQHYASLGRPLYLNQAQNFIMLGARGYGKSYTVAGMTAHEFLFDGKQSFADLSEKTTSVSVIGAGDSKYSTETLSKVKVIMDMLPGDLQVGDRYFSSPLRKMYSGSFAPGTGIIAKYKKKFDGEWRMAGSKSTIQHRTFRDNAFAVNGMRIGYLVFEEIGMFNNLKSSYVASVETQRDGKNKFGSMFLIGTGGDMDGGGTLDAYEMFYNPVAFDALTFEDTWEYRGKIGFFIPAYLGLNQFKKKGVTDESKALKFLIQEREKLAKGKATTSLEGEIINRPVKPSEIFLVKHGNMFPVMELQDRLSTLRNYDNIDYGRLVVDLFFSSRGSAINGVDYKVDVEGKLEPIDTFPAKDRGSREGAVVIYELPETDDEGNVPEDMYLIGHDPYRTDSPTGPSLATIFVLKTKKYATTYGHDEIVAVYRGRPYNGRNVVNETLLKLSLFYGNAKIFFENEVGNVKEYFEKQKKLHLLAKQPTTILSKKAAHQSKTSQVVYGYPMSNRKFKMEGVHYLRDWLLEERGEVNGTVMRNLDKIPDQALLQELISFNLDGNFDSVMGFMGCIFGMEEHYNTFEEQLTDVRTAIDDSMEFFSNNTLFQPRDFLPNGGHDGVFEQRKNFLF
jgi:hypothetical protein